ncbi:MAG TPA: hypothetical protein VKE40_27465 [Gemmataceae bacterium]|nr:hypothetical protein [Gemmataceae bacterium]
MKKLLSLAVLVAAMVAMGAAIGCDDKKSTSKGSGTTPAGGGTGSAKTSGS